VDLAAVVRQEGGNDEHQAHSQASHDDPLASQPIFYPSGF